MSMSDFIVPAVLALFVFGCIGVYEYKHAKPGTVPTGIFHDEDEWYSADGCWHLQNGYWRPLRRCHIVRVPAP